MTKHSGSDDHTESGSMLKRLEELIISNRDLSVALEQKEAIIRDREKDPLTGTFNRFYFETAAKSLAGRDLINTAVIAADVNGLRRINEIQGFEAGTKVIVKASEIISNTSGDDSMIIHIGSGSFCIILRNSDKEKVKEVCDKLTSCRSVSLASGCYLCSDTSESLETGYMIAETRMCRRKLLEPNSVRSSIVTSVISTLKERYDDTHENLNRMVKLCLTAGSALGFENHMRDELELVCILHDLGKIAIRETIINKNAKLTKEEKKEIQNHPEIGSHILRSVPEFKHVSDYILSHHEKWDGTGYPRKLKGEEIPLISRIIALADAYDSMTSGRPYRDPLPMDFVINEIRSCAGTQFDPVIAQIFIDIILKDQ